MKGIFIFSMFCFLSFSSCSLRQREIELDKKNAEINQREQQLTLKEQTLALREQQLNEKEKLLDSTTQKIVNDNLSTLYPQLPGDWNVKMQATETNCPGSAVGDTKNEIWNFRYQGNSIIASARSGSQLVRLYTGTYNGTAIKLTLQQDSSDTHFSKMAVWLQRVNENEMVGEREIIQASGCRIVYSLELKKQKK